MTRRLILLYVLFCMLVAALVFTADYFLKKYGIIVPYFWGIYLFFAVATAVFHLVAIRSAKGDAKAFIRTYMGSSLGRIMMYAVIILIFRFVIGKEHIMPFALAFMAMYFIFSIFEVAALISQLRKSG